MRHISTRALSILISRYIFNRPLHLISRYIFNRPLQPISQYIFNRPLQPISQYIFNRPLHSVFHLFCVLLSVISFSAISFSAISLCSQLRAQTPPPSPPPSQPPPLPEYSTLYQGVEHRSQAQEPMNVLITLPVEEQLEDLWSADEPRPDEPHLSPLSSLPLIFIPLPLIYVSVGDELQLTVDNRGATSVSFTQSVLLSDPTAPAPLFITPSDTQTEYRLKATQSAAGTYTIRRGRELWRGVIISAPERSVSSPDSSSDLTSLWENMPILRAHINLAQSQADTRRSVPWTWSLHSSSLSPYFLREVKAGLALNHAHPDSPPPPPPPPETQLRGPLAFVNMSELPIALDLPTSVKILGGTYTTQSPPSQVLRVPQTETRGVLSLLSPGEGCVLWSTTPLQREGRGWVKSA